MPVVVKPHPFCLHLAVFVICVFHSYYLNLERGKIKAIDLPDWHVLLHTRDVFSGKICESWRFSNFRYRVEEDNSLFIKKLMIFDMGMFQCFARNEAGESSIATWLKVKSKSIFAPQLCRFFQTALVRLQDERENTEASGKTFCV